MNASIILRKHDEYVEKGRAALKAATDYLKENCADWDGKHNENWVQLLRIAEFNLVIASSLAEVIKEAHE